MPTSSDLPQVSTSRCCSYRTDFRTLPLKPAARLIPQQSCTPANGPPLARIGCAASSIRCCFAVLRQPHERTAVRQMRDLCTSRRNLRIAASALSAACHATAMRWSVPGGRTPLRQSACPRSLSAPQELDFLHPQCRAFVRDRERHLRQGFSKPCLEVGVGRLDHSVNWTQRQDTRNVQLTAVASADGCGLLIMHAVVRKVTLWDDEKLRNTQEARK